MASLNKVFLIGNVTRDPEIRYTSGGAALCVLGLAVNRKYTTSKGEDRDETCFVDIDIWGRQAESCHNYLRKGAPVFVEGRLRYDQWEDRDTGHKRSRLLVTAERVQFLGAPARSASFDETRPAIPQKFQDAIADKPILEPPPFPKKTVTQEQEEPTTSEVDKRQEEPMDDIPF